MTHQDLHVICERDVGLFSLIQQVLANLPWAIGEGRTPVVRFGPRTSYWRPEGHRGADNVWEYYFEPLVPSSPASVIPPEVERAIEDAFPDQDDLGDFIAPRHFVTNNFGEHEAIRSKALQIPYTTGDPDDALRAVASNLITQYIRPRDYVVAKADAFGEAHMAGHRVIGVHVRGTDAVSSAEQRDYRQGSLSFERLIAAIDRASNLFPESRVLVATDAESSLERLRREFGSRVIAYDAIRDQGGEAAGTGPTGRIMPGYISDDSSVAAQNGEDAVVEYLLLGRCDHLVHNGASLATTVLLSQPALHHTNTRRPQ